MDDSEYSKSYKTLKQVRFKYHALLTRNLTHDAYVNTKSLLRRPEKVNFIQLLILCFIITAIIIADKPHGRCIC